MEQFALGCFFEYVRDFADGLIWVILYVVRILFEKRSVYEVRIYDVIGNPCEVNSGGTKEDEQETIRAV